jgi:nitrogen fixation protein FixH
MTVKIKPPPHVLWPALIAGALFLHVAVSLVTVWIATSNPSYAVEENYYRKAVDWDATQAQQRHNAELGWRLDFEVTPTVSPGADPTLAVRLSGAGGRPLDGATVSVEAFHTARAGEILRAELAPVGDGRYSTPLAMRRSGLWELRFNVEHSGERFTHTETRYVNLEATPQSKVES